MSQFDKQNKRTVKKMKVGKTLQTLLSFFIAFAMVFPGAVKVEAIDSYPVDQNSIVLDADFTGDSINDHTFAKAIWTYNDYVYLMVDSTHNVESITLYSGSGSVTSSDPMMHGYTVIVGGTTYNADESEGNTGSSHLTVFKFSLSDILTNLKLNEGGIYNIDVISEQGKGHWIIGGTLAIRIPKAEVKVTKSWENGPKDSVSIQLYRKLKDADNSSYTAFGDAFNLTTANPTKTISNLNFTDNIGRIYTYTAKEVNIGEGYKSEVTASGPTLVNGVQVFTIAIKNTYTPPMTDIKVTKVWKDGDDPSARPPSLTYYLYADGAAEPVKTGTADKPNWDYTFKDLPKTLMDGTAITYSVKEAPVPGYTTSINGLVVTNVRSEKRDVDVAKSWKDGDDPSGRPTTVTFNLFANGTKVDSVALTSAKNWKHTFEDLEKYDTDGKLIKYTVTEDAVSGYTPSIDGLTITNLRIGKTDIPVEKLWNDDGPDVRPQSIRINLLANGTEVAEKDITAAMDWKYTFSQVDKYDSNGQLIIYTIKEDAVSGYKSDVKGFKVTNTKVGTTNIDVTKIWMDDNDTEGRPASITIYLYANGNQVDSAQLTAEGSWKYTFKDKPAFSNDGKSITYTLKEIDVTGYKSTIDGFTVTNLRTGLTKVEGTKFWFDENGSSMRPDDITVILLRNGEEFDRETVQENTEGLWKYSFTELPEFDDKGVAYKYTIDEVSVSGYETKIDGYNIKNTRSGEIDIPVEKIWLDDGQRTIDEITVKLYKKVVSHISMALESDITEELVKTLVLDSENEWKDTFENLPEFDEKGYPIEYFVEEIPVEGYTSSIKENEDRSITITNLRTGKIDIPVEKKWMDNGERSIVEVTITLSKQLTSPPPMEPGSEISTSAVALVPVETLVLDAENEWKGTFKDLDEFDKMGHPITYIVEEEIIEGYTSSKMMNEDGSYTFTNLRTGLVDIEGEKTWFDEDEESRPDFITVVLMRNDKEVDRVDVTEEEGLWTYSFKDLPEFDDKGIAYLYEIEELPVDDYNTFILGYDIQNVRTGFVNVNGEKTWDDLMRRPESITINLLQNGVEIDDVTITKDTEGMWKYSFTELPEFDEEGISYVYSVTEDALEGYKPTITGYDIMNRQLRGTLEILKIDDFDDPVKDVVFEIDDTNGVLIYRGTTDEDGILKVTLPLGTYIVRETSAPDDYIMDDKEKTIMIDEDGETVKLTVVNILEFEDVGPLPDTGGKPKPTLPKTGAQSSFIWYGIGAMITLAGFTLLKKKKTIR